MLFVQSNNVIKELKMFKYMKFVLILVALFGYSCTSFASGSKMLANNLGIKLYAHDTHVPAKHKARKKPQSLQDFARHLGQDPQSAQVDDAQGSNDESLQDFAAKIGREDTSYQNIGQESHQELHQNNEYTGPSHIYQMS
jgi:hypothetical protein